MANHTHTASSSYPQEASYVYFPQGSLPPVSMALATQQQQPPMPPGPFFDDHPYANPVQTAMGPATAPSHARTSSQLASMASSSVPEDYSFSTAPTASFLQSLNTDNSKASSSLLGTSGAPADDYVSQLQRELQESRAVQAQCYARMKQMMSLIDKQTAHIKELQQQLAQRRGSLSQ
ncbi:hypothetical protein BC940DRAFT_315593 [Gongronella butleri]|nr:hypothetical protein BC940DRAFT_315593 [Gongronella butleri]